MILHIALYSVSLPTSNESLPDSAKYVDYLTKKLFQFVKPSSVSQVSPSAINIHQKTHFPLLFFILDSGLITTR